MMAKSATIYNSGGTPTTISVIVVEHLPPHIIYRVQVLLPRRKIMETLMAFIFFREKVRPFPHLAKPISRTFRKDEKAMVQIKRDWFDTALKNYERGEMYGRWKEKIQV